MTLTLDVLGSCGSGPTRISPASGYLVRSETTAIWVDAGTGTFLELARRIDPADLAATVISHLHADHCADLFGWFHHLAYRLQLDHAIPVLLPPGGTERIENFLGQSGPTDPLHTVLDLTDVVDGDKLEDRRHHHAFRLRRPLRAHHCRPDRARRQGPRLLGGHRPGRWFRRPRRRCRRRPLRGGALRAQGGCHLPVPPLAGRREPSPPPPGRARWCSPISVRGWSPGKRWRSPARPSPGWSSRPGPDWWSRWGDERRSPAPPGEMNRRDDQGR